MGEFRQGKERGKIILFGVLYLLGAVVCAILVFGAQVKGFMDVLFSIAGLAALYFTFRQIVDYISDPVIKVDATGMTATGYFPRSQDFSFKWEEVGKAYAKATTAGGGTVTFYAKSDPNKVLGIIHGYSRFVNLPQLRDLIKQYMGESPSYA